MAETTPAFLIEKPLTTQLEQVPALKHATRGKVAGVAYVYRAHPGVQAARELIRAGKIGELLQVTIVTGQHFPTFRPAYREIYYKDRATGGGAIQDAVTHMCDLVQFVAGDFNWVFCDASHQALPGVEVEDTVHLVGRVANERVMVTIALNQFMAPNEGFIHLNGSQGSVELRLHESRWGLLRHDMPDWEWTPFPLKERDDLFRLQAAHFLGPVREPSRCCALWKRPSEHYG
ncbi:MAG: Gfo/Idh/MocA family oxidoreductase [Planctomycetales bacterium]